MRRILHSAARQGAEQGLERVQMHDVAKESGVAIATLYRYFPSKLHLFTAVMRDRVERMEAAAARVPRHRDPVVAITEMLVDATAQMMAAPLLAQAMMIANNAVLHDSASHSTEPGMVFSRLLLSTAGIDDPTPRDRQLVRLIEHGWYGAINSAINRQRPWEELEDDVRVTCRLLLVDWARS